MADLVEVEDSAISSSNSDNSSLQPLMVKNKIGESERNTLIKLKKALFVKLEYNWLQENARKSLEALFDF